MSVLSESPIIQAGSREIPFNRAPPRSKRLGQTLMERARTLPFGDEIDFGGGPPSSPIRLMVTDSPFMDLADWIKAGQPSTSRPLMSSPPRKQLKSPAHYIVLLNRRSGIPLAVCALKAASTGPPVVRIYTTKRRVFGQRPAASTQSWVSTGRNRYRSTRGRRLSRRKTPRCCKVFHFHGLRPDGRFEDTPSYRATHHASSPVIRMVGRTERDAAQCAVISLSQDEDATDEHGVSISQLLEVLTCSHYLLCGFLGRSRRKAMRLRK
jgi:hypothetical protein